MKLRRGMLLIILLGLLVCCIIGVGAVLWFYPLGQIAEDLGFDYYLDDYDDYYDDGYYDDYYDDDEYYDDGLPEAGPPIVIQDGEMPALSEVPLFRQAACPFPGGENQRFVCGYLFVPEDRQNPDSAVIALAVAILKPASGAPGPVPLVYLEGGPGGSALDGADLWLNSSLGQGRNIILVDQRGTGYSQPSLNCTEYDSEAYDTEVEITEACHDRLAGAGIDLAEYHSAESAADIADLRVAMGYEQIDLLGISYGTRLALTVMRDHPEGIRAVILDSVYPPHVDALTEEALVSIRAIEQLFAGCAQDADCARAYPNLEDAFYEMVSAMNRTPAEIEYEDGTEEMWGDDVVGMILQNMYDTKVIPYLPAFIYTMYEGDHYYALDILDMPYANEPYDDSYDESAVDVSDAEGAYNSVECYEEVMFNDLSAAERLVAGYPEILTEGMIWNIETYFDICQVWGVGQAGGIENQPVVSAIPTLVLNGAYDPVTPPDWARRAAEHLSNSQLFIFPNAGHAVIDAHPCAETLMLDFLADPYAPVDGSCVAGVGPPDFVANP